MKHFVDSGSLAWDVRSRRTGIPSRLLYYSDHLEQCLHTTDTHRTFVNSKKVETVTISRLLPWKVVLERLRQVPGVPQLVGGKSQMPCLGGQPQHPPTSRTL